MDRQLATQLVEQYLQSWRTQDLALFLSTLSQDATIVECYGPIYQGTKEVQQWFTEWHASPIEGKVTHWKMTNLIFDERKMMAAVEWDFGCVCEGNWDSFLGASMF
jgi:ketosteroid isomerase-like protein